MVLWGRKKIAGWLISSYEDAEWFVRLASCSEKHAQSVLAQLEGDPHTPNKLRLEKVTK